MRRGWPLWLGIFAMFAGTVAVVIGILAFGGGGKQRGLVIRNESGQVVTVRFDDGTALHMQDHQEKTIAAKRSEYPQTMHVTNATGSALWQKSLTFADLSTNSFRLVIGPTDIIPTPPQTDG